MKGPKKLRKIRYLSNQFNMHRKIFDEIKSIFNHKFLEKINFLAKLMLCIGNSYCEMKLIENLQFQKIEKKSKFCQQAHSSLTKAMNVHQNQYSKEKFLIPKVFVEFMNSWNKNTRNTLDSNMLMKSLHFC